MTRHAAHFSEDVGPPLYLECKYTTQSGGDTLPSTYRVRVPSGEALPDHIVETLEESAGVALDITEIRYADDEHDEFILTERVK